MYNYVAIMGRFADDPDLKTTTENNLSVCSFTLACERNVSRQAENYAVDWIHCVAWRKTAENIARTCHKGDTILVFGRLQTRTWTDMHKDTRYETEIVLDGFQYITPKKKQDEYADVDVPQTSAGRAPSRPHSNRSARFTELPDDGELPF